MLGMLLGCYQDDYVNSLFLPSAELWNFLTQSDQKSFKN